jgi:hypothetical protein
VKWTASLAALAICAPSLWAGPPAAPPVTVDDRPLRAAPATSVAPPVTVDDRPQKPPTPPPFRSPLRPSFQPSFQPSLRPVCLPGGS